MNATTYGLDVAKRVFQMYWVDAQTGEIVNRQFGRDELIGFFGAAAGRPGGVRSVRQWALVGADLPVDAFWSVSVYNADGYYEKNSYDAYTINNLIATKSADGVIAIQFGGCDGKLPNCLPTVKGWNYMVRLYRPRPEILSGKWKFPEPQPVS